MTYVDVAALLGGGMPEDDYELTGFGTVRVRALTRIEALAFKEDDLTTRERKLLTWCFVEPRLSEAQAGEFMKHITAGDAEKLVTFVLGLSGMLEGDDTSAYKSDGSEPGS